MSGNKMNGKSYDISFGMVLRKFYCAKCGARLEREQTHRVVTKYDVDYFQYQDYGSFPRRDWDVYAYRFKCPDCGARSTYDEQRIIAKIQKKRGQLLLSSYEIRDYHTEGEKHNRKALLCWSILVPILLTLVSFVCFCFAATDVAKDDFRGIAVLCLLAAACTAIAGIRRHKGSAKRPKNVSYSYEKETQMKNLFAYSVCNREMVAIAEKCYCFSCKEMVDPREITDYADDGQTAICPKCGKDTILPDSIEEALDEKIVREMNEYWF